MRCCVQKINRLLALLAAVTLVFSFGLHSIQIDHEHYQSYSTPTNVGVDESASHTHASAANDADMVLLGEKMHMSDKKLFILLLSLSVYALSQFAVTWTERLNLQSKLVRIFSLVIKQASYRIYFYLEILFARGILNPKPY